MSPSPVSPDMKILARLAHMQRQFDSLYLVPARTNLCPPMSYGLTLPSPVAPVCSTPSATHNVLNRYASYVSQFDFGYPDTRDLFQEMFSHSFLTVRSRAPETEDTSLKELNRLARLAEMTSDNFDIYPVYQPATYAHLIDCRRKYGSKSFPNPFLSKLRSSIHLNEDSTFVKAFPKTQTPKVSLSFGQPKIDSAQFASLFRFKTAQLRQRLGINHTPKGLARHVSQWISTILLGLLKTGKAKTISPPSKKEFVKPANPEKIEPPASEDTLPEETVRPPSRAAIADSPYPLKSYKIYHLTHVPDVCGREKIPSFTELLLPDPPSNDSSDFDIREARLSIKSLLRRCTFYLRIIGQTQIPISELNDFFSKYAVVAARIGFAPNQLFRFKQSFDLNLWDPESTPVPYPFSYDCASVLELLPAIDGILADSLPF
jgi:hypothetical protein